MSSILEVVDATIAKVRTEAGRENVFVGRASYALSVLLDLRSKLEEIEDHAHARHDDQDR